MGKKRDMPHVPDIHKAGVPRCPLCGIVLDMSIELETTDTATMTITAKSAAHVARPHTVNIPADWN